MKSVIAPVGLLMLVAVLPARADDLRPLYIEISEREGHEYVLQKKAPPGELPDNNPEVVFPQSCRAIQAVRLGIRIDCDNSLSGTSLTIRYPRREVPNATVVKVALASGESHTMALASGVRTFKIPGPEDAASVAAQYTRLGVEHIWVGFDHLLFLLCLIWIAGTWQRILITVTGFTLAHSLTLALSALEVLILPVPPVEAAIALSVLFLATEVTKGLRASLTWRNPIAVSGLFGLLHGLGFAAVLGDIGLPRQEVVTGLVFFNLGVELGQVAFALGVILLLRLIAAGSDGSMATRVRPVMGYAVGCVSAYWLIARVAAF